MARFSELVARLLATAIALLSLPSCNSCEGGEERTVSPVAEATDGARAIDAGNQAPWMQYVPAAEGDVQTLVHDEVLRARADGVRLVVYVGASWCEPCQRFHTASLSGALDRRLPRIRFLEFDLDRDEPRLQEAGYTSKYIPLFAVPNEDGRASGKYIEGSIKGEGAADEITPRLARLLAP